MTRWLVSGMLVLACGGCALFDRGSATESGAEGTDRTTGQGSPVRAERRIARDFLHALSQLEGYAPDDAPVRFAAATLAGDPLVAELETLMRERGYAVRVLERPGPDTVAHEVDVDGDDGRAATTHTLSVGAVQLRRRYALVDGRWRPVGSLYVRGADASGVRMDDLDDEETDGVDRAVPTPVPRRSLEQMARSTEPVPGPAPGRTPSAPVASASSAERSRSPRAAGRAPRPASYAGAGGGAPASAPDAASAPTRSARAGAEAPLAIDRLSGKPVYSGLVAGARGALPLPRNVMDLGGSNFEGLLENYADVDEKILVFPNDSLVLGDDNKRQIRTMLERFDRRRDMFSIVGCSLGPTRLENGNEALALGRANRVKEELMFAGVPRERILDEGCWAGEAAARFPSRGVVLTLRRAAG